MRLTTLIGHLGLGLTLAGAAAAQVETRSKAPIDITANEAEAINSRCVVIWRGAAEALQGDARLRADTLTVYSKTKTAGANGQHSCGGSDRIEAEGAVYYLTPQQNVRGDHAVYSAEADQIIISGNVVVVQGLNVARADRLTIKISTKEAKMDSAITGAGKAGRVRGVFYPDKDTQSPADAAAKP